jgi:hypothetical protein
MPDTFNKIATVTVGAGGAATMAFSSIPQTYTDLIIKISLRDTNAAVYQFSNVTFNGSTSGYSVRYLEGNGSAASSYAGSGSALSLMLGNGANGTANIFGNTDFYIPNYTSSNAKSLSVDQVNENNATSAFALLQAGLWTGTAPITSISIGLGAGNFVQYSTATLYGISKS